MYHDKIVTVASKKCDKFITPTIRVIVRLLIKTVHQRWNCHGSRIGHDFMSGHGSRIAHGTKSIISGCK